MQDNNTRIYGVDFVKMLAVLGVFIYHIAVQLDIPSIESLINVGVNCRLGRVCVTIFFCASGFLIHGSNNDRPVKEYVGHRTKAIYPMFYLTYIFFYLVRIIKTHIVFWAPKWTIILTILGLDGYLLYLYPNHYILGEWFLGAIIILYLLYIPIRSVIKKGELLKFFPLAFIVILYIGLVFYNPFKIEIFRNIISCLLIFVFGIYIKELNLVDKLYGLCICSILSLIILFVSLSMTPIPEHVLEHVLGVSLFIILCFAGNYICRYKPVRFIAVKISGLSYAIYLVHHVLIDYGLGYYSPLNLQEVIIFAIILFAITVVVSIVFNYINNKIIGLFSHKE